MGQGLQVWNASGALIFDTPDRASRIFGSVIVGATASGTITLPSGYGTYWWHIMPQDGSRYVCGVSISGTTLSYGPTTIYTPAVECIVLYGAY